MMFIKNRAFIKCVVVLVLLMIGMAAIAQSPGLKIGNGLLHPRFTLKTAYNTNVTNRHEDPLSDFILSFEPGVAANIPSQMVRLILNFSIGYDKYLGTSDSNTADLSNLSSNALMDLTFLPDGPFSITVNEVFVRSDNPANNSLNQRLGSIYSRTGLMFDIAPWGRSLTLQLAGSYALTRFDSSLDADYLNSSVLGAGFMAKWRFLPKTAFILNADFGAPSYKDEYKMTTVDANNKAKPVTFTQPGQYYYKLQAGLLGQFSSHTVLTFRAGYGATNDSEAGGGNGSYKSVIGTVDFMYYLNAASVIQFGYLRGVDLTPIYGFVSVDRPYLLANYVFADRYKLGFETEFSMYHYGRPPTTIVDANIPSFSEEDRTDNVFRLSVPASVAVLRWLFIEPSLSFDMHMSNIDIFSYNAFVGTIGVRAEY